MPECSLANFIHVWSVIVSLQEGTWSRQADQHQATKQVSDRVRHRHENQECSWAHSSGLGAQCRSRGDLSDVDRECLLPVSDLVARKSLGNTGPESWGFLTLAWPCRNVRGSRRDFGTHPVFGVFFFHLGLSLDGHAFWCRELVGLTNSDSPVTQLQWDTRILSLSESGLFLLHCRPTLCLARAIREAQVTSKFAPYWVPLKSL